MPTFIKPKAIRIKVDNGTGGQVVKVTNFTAGKSFTGVLNSSKETVIKNDSSVQWADGDVIQVEIQGKIIATSRSTISGGGKSFTITASADTSTPGIDL